MNMITTKRVKRQGSSLVTILTKELKDLGIKEGDLVEIEIKRTGGVTEDTPPVDH